jgi:hypothetical protein
MRLFPVLLLSLVLAAPTPAGAAEREPGPQSAYLVGLDIHTPRGRVVHVPLPQRRAADTTLYGRTGEGWLVRVRCGVFLVAGGERSRLRHARPCGSQGDHTEMLSDDRRQFLMTDDQQGAGIVLEAVALDGGRRPVVYVDEGVDVLDATDGRAYVETYHELVEVDLDTGTTQVVAGRRPALVDLETDTVFLEGSRRPYRFGPTTLSDPGRLEWRKRFRPTDVSPDRTYALGDEILAYDNPGRLEVRRMSDGGLVRRLPRPDTEDGYTVVGFDSADSVVMVATSGARRAVVRCGLPVGRCTRVTRLTRLAVSLPTATVGPDRNGP